MNTDHKYLSDAIAAASAAVGDKLAPDKTNKEQQYDYLSADMILAIAGQALADNGVTIFPSVTDEALMTNEHTGRDGKPKQRFDAKVTMGFTLSYGGSSLSFPWIGRGSDYSVPDKAVYKAITSGHKYFLMKLLNIGAGNEDGEHEDEPKPGRQTAQKAAAKPAGPPPEWTEPAATNGNGHAKPERPYVPVALRDALLVSGMMRDDHGEKLTEGQAKGFVMNLERLFEDDPDAQPSAARPALINFLFGNPSTADLTDGQKVAVQKWLNIKKDAAGAFAIDPLAKAEAALVLEAVIGFTAA